MKQYIYTFFKQIKNVMFIILNFLSYLSPRDKNIWVFGSWFGEKFADNSKYLFLYVIKEHPEIKAIWLTHNDKVLKELKYNGYKVFKIWSWKGIYYSLRARVCVISVSLSDVNKYFLGSAMKINLWHGTPLKKIGLDAPHAYSINQSKSSYITGLIRKYILRGKEIKLNSKMNNIIIASSYEVKKNLMSAFKVPPENVVITGYPRNDALFETYYLDLGNSDFLKEIKKKISFKYLITYLPTFRDHHVENYSIIESINLDIETINSFLENINAIFILKEHFYNSYNHPTALSYKRVFIITDSELSDLYPLLKHTDILITDYSSVYFDFLLLDRPIIFYPLDIDEYVKKDRPLYYDYNSVTPGPKAKNWVEVMKFIEQELKEDHWKEERQRVSRIFNTYVDNQNSKRVFEQILKII